MTTDILFAVLLAAMLTAVCNDQLDAAELPAIEGIELSEISIPSSVDGKPQPVVVGVPESYEEGAATPLLVGMHTWSSHYLQMVGPYSTEAAKRDWLVVCPNFRGANLTSNPNATEAGGSILAQHDIIDAIEYMKAHYSVDDRRIYMTGGSGGGHITSLMAAKYPDVFAACVAWCPITDYRDWQGQGNSYAQHVEAVCGGKPGDSPEVDFEYLRRSPRTFITNAAHTHLLIGHGDKDGTIWPEQSWETYRRLKALPAHKVLFRSWSAGHVGKTAEGLEWAATKVRSPDVPGRLDIVTDEAKSYFWLQLGPVGPLTLGKCTAVLTRGGGQEGTDEATKTTLSLETTDVAGVRVDLRALGLGAPADPPEGATSEDGALILRPGAGSHKYDIAF